MRTLSIFFFGLLLLGGLASCSNSVVDPSTDPSTIYQANLTDIKNYAVSKGFSGSTTSSGLYYAQLKSNPSGISPAYGQELEFNYRLYALYGPSNVTGATSVTDFLLDTTYLTTSTFRQFYSASLLPGLEEGLLKMREGEQAVMIMPSILAFGSASTTNLPANSPIRFDVKLIRARTEDQQINDYIVANKLTVTQLNSDGVRFILTKANPTGAVPKAGQTLNITYAGKLLRATSGFSGGTGVDTKTAGVAKYVTGFEEGLALLKVGEKATIIFPSSLGYGATGATDQSGTVVIPPYSPISFDIEVVSAQ